MDYISTGKAPIDNLTGTRKVSSLPQLTVTNMTKGKSVNVPAAHNGKTYMVDISKMLQGDVLKVTRAQLTSLMNSGSLIPGSTYILEGFISYTYPGTNSKSSGYSIPTNYDILGKSNYIQITPVLTAVSTSELSRTGRLLEYPNIEIGFLLNPGADSYYAKSSGRLPDKAYENGVITYMHDKSRNIYCEFDFINGVVMHRGRHYLSGTAFKMDMEEYPNFFLREGEYNLHESLVGVNDFLQNYSSKITTESFRSTYRAFSTQSVGGEISTNNMRSSNAQVYGSRYFDYNSKEDGTLDRKYTREAPSDSYKSGHWTVAHLMRDMLGYNNSRTTSSKNIFISRSECDLSTRYFLSNVPSVILESALYYRLYLDPADSQWKTTLLRYASYKSPVFRNLTIKNSDFIYINQTLLNDDDELESDPTVLDNNIEITNSYGIYLNRLRGTVKVDHSLFVTLTETEDSSITKGCYIYCRTLLRSSFNSVSNYRVQHTVNSELKYVYGLLGGNGSSILDSVLKHIGCYGNNSIGKWDIYYRSAIDILTNVNFQKVNQINSNQDPGKSIMISYKDCNFSDLNVLRVGFTSCTSYSSTAIEDSSTAIKLTDLKNKTAGGASMTSNTVYVKLEDEWTIYSQVFIQGVDIRSDNASLIIAVGQFYSAARVSHLGLFSGPADWRITALYPASSTPSTNSVGTYEGAHRICYGPAQPSSSVNSSHILPLSVVYEDDEQYVDPDPGAD